MIFQIVSIAHKENAWTAKEITYFELTESVIKLVKSLVTLRTLTRVHVMLVMIKPAPNVLDPPQRNVPVVSLDSLRITDAENALISVKLVVEL